MKPIKLLLNWYDQKDRPEFLLPFSRIAAANNMAVKHLWHRQATEPTYNEVFDRINWFDYRDAYRLLDDVQPDIVITAAGMDLLSISLIIACNNRGIPIYIMQHGIISDDIYTELPSLKRNYFLSLFGKFGLYLRTMQFFTTVFNNRNRSHFGTLTRFFYGFLRDDAYTACSKHIFALRRPTGYIVFNEKNKEFYRRRDGASEDQFHIIGVPYFDDLFNVQAAPAQDNYVLLIDTELSSEDTKIVTIERKNQFYAALNDYCMQRGLRLIIKLHPSSYRYDNLLVHGNIEYIRYLDQLSLVTVAMNAVCIFSFYSTLSFTLMFRNRRMAFIKIRDLYPKDLVQFDKIKFLDFYDMQLDKLDIDDIYIPDEACRWVEDNYIYRSDGKSVQRLEQLILSSSKAN